MARRHFLHVFHGTFFFCKRGVGCDAFFGKRNLCPNCASKARLRPKTFLQSGGAICDRTPRTPPQTARGPKKNQNAFQLPLVSGHPAAPEGPEPIIPLLTLFWGSGGGPGGALRPKARSAWRARGLSEGPQSQRRLPNAKEREKRAPLSLTNRSQRLSQTPEAK